MASKRSPFWGDEHAAALTEFAYVMPLMLILVLGSMEFSVAVWQRSAVQKAAQLGVRMAVVSDPVASNLMSGLFTGTSVNGGVCADQGTGTTPANCQITATDCTFSTTNNQGTCTNGRTFSGTAFDLIFNAARRAYPSLTKNNLRVSYASNGLGFFGDPEGVPVTVTVTIRCLSYDFYVLKNFRVFTPPAANQGCPAIATTRWPMADISASLTSEDLDSSVP